MRTSCELHSLFYGFSTENYRQIVNLLNVASGGIGRRGAVCIVSELNATEA